MSVSWESSSHPGLLVRFSRLSQSWTTFVPFVSLLCVSFQAFRAISSNSFQRVPKFRGAGTNAIFASSCIFFEKEEEEKEEDVNVEVEVEVEEDKRKRRSTLPQNIYAELIPAKKKNCSCIKNNSEKIKTVTA